MPLLLLVRFLQHGIYQLCRFIRLGCAALRFRKFLCGFLAAAAFDFTLNAAHINRCKLKTLKNAVDLACILRSNHHIRNTVISIPVLQHAVQHTILLGCLAKLLQISVLHSKDFQFFAASQHIRQPRLTLGLFLFTQNGIQKNSDLFRACTGDFGGNFSPERTKICCTRYGNILCSRGSVVPLWIEQMKAGKPLTITEPEMTRFVMSLEEAVDLVLFAFEHGESGDILVQKAPACTIAVLAQAVRELFCPEAETRVIGIRHGEKLYETLLTNEECAHALDLGGFYRVPCDKRDLNYDKYFTQGDQTRNTLTEFNSNNTALLNVEQVKEKLLALPYIQQELAEWEKQA